MDLKQLFSLFFLFSSFLSCSIAQGVSVDPAIQIRDGYQLNVVQAAIAGPRFLQMDDDGILYVSLPEVGQIKSCKDTDNDGYYDAVETFVSGHRTVHGMQWHDGWLWFTETGVIYKARDTNGDGKADEKVTVIPKGVLPEGGGHWWRPVLVHKDRIYTAIGCSGNITDETDTERLKIWSFALDGSDKQYFAGGLRNTEKLLIRPGTDEIWGMDHGSDWFGGEMEKKVKHGQPITDLNPPCELNHYVKDGFYGHPYITGNRVPRYEYMNRSDIVEWAAKTIPPAWSTGAHWAPNGFSFYTGNQFPDDVKGDVFVAYHGSWNRTSKAGYCISRILFDEGRPYGELKYVSFLGEDEEVLGRPVDVIVAPDGSLLISDDWGNKVYRLSYMK
jgi:glucose/arabinose dehydrogenase